MMERDYAPKSDRYCLDYAFTILKKYGHASLLPSLCKTNYIDIGHQMAKKGKTFGT